MTDLIALSAVVPAVAEYLSDNIVRYENECDVNVVDEDAADAALTATVDYYEARLLERERCGSCQHSGEMCPWPYLRCLDKTPFRFVKAHDPCHFIDAEHPHGRFEPVGGA
jgi:hypothetical protein